MKTPNKKTAVIFGGAGFIGHHLIVQLEQESYDIHVADLINPNLPNITFHHCDVRKPINIDIPNSPFVIFNLAAVHRTPGHDLDEYYDTNVSGAINLVEWSEFMKCSRIVFTSSIAVYGPGNEVKDENSQLEPIHAYGKSKLLAEKIFTIWQNKDNSHRKLVICRPAVIFGAGEHGNFTRMAHAIASGRFVIPGNREIVKSSGYVLDLVSSMLFTLKHDQNSILYNFAFPKEYSIEHISLSMASIGGYKRPLNIKLTYILPFLLKFYPLRHLGRRIEKLLVPTRIAPKYLLQTGFKWRFDLEDSLNDWFRKTQFDSKGGR